MDLLARKGPLGVRAVAQQLGLPPASVHRLLLDLAEEQVVERNADGDWMLAVRLMQIVGVQLDRIELPKLARPFAEHIAHVTGETVNINALVSGAGVCVDKVRGNERMQLDLRIGSRGPLHCGGAGKAMLAYMAELERERVLAGPLPALTPKTITDAAILKRELKTIRQRGYSIDDQEVVLGVYCVAVPIFDRDGLPAGAMSITGPSPKRPGPEIEGWVGLLSDACHQVSERLGYVGPWPLIDVPVARKRAAGR